MEEYFDGEIGARTAELTGAHLVVCAACASAYRELGREQELYARYSREVEVTPALWAGVSARIAAERRAQTERQAGGGLPEWTIQLFAAPRFSLSLTAALILVAVGLTIGVMRYTGLLRKSEP